MRSKNKSSWKEKQDKVIFLELALFLSNTSIHMFTDETLITFYVWCTISHVKGSIRRLLENENHWPFHTVQTLKAHTNKCSRMCVSQEIKGKNKQKSGKFCVLACQRHSGGSNIYFAFESTGGILTIGERGKDIFWLSASRIQNYTTTLCSNTSSGKTAKGVYTLRLLTVTHSWLLNISCTKKKIFLMYLNILCYSQSVSFIILLWSKSCAWLTFARSWMMRIVFVLFLGI